MRQDISQALFQNNRPVALVALASLGLITAALFFEYVIGLAPCKLCLTQRLPHYGLIALGLISTIRPSHQLLWRSVGALLASVTAGVGLQHVGVEQGWWQGPQGCSSQINAEASLADLTTALLATPVVRCDEVAWSFLSISMAGWNMIISALLAFFLIAASFHFLKKQEITN